MSRRDLALAAQKGLVGTGVLIVQQLVQPLKGRQTARRGGSSVRELKMVDDPFLGFVQDFEIIIKPGVFKGDGDVVADGQKQLLIIRVKKSGWFC
jgi:hypothetical protein